MEAPSNTGVDPLANEATKEIASLLAQVAEQEKAVRMLEEKIEQLKALISQHLGDSAA
jgi:hypothetical protein